MNVLLAPDPDLACKAAALVCYGAQKVSHGWLTDLAIWIATGAGELLAETLTFWTKADRSSMLREPGIAEIQSLVKYVGVVLLIGSVIWQGLLMAVKRKVEPLVNTGMGLLAYVGWSTMGTTLALLLYEGGLALSAQVLDASIAMFATRLGTAMIASAGTSTALVFLVGIGMFFLALVQWVLGFFRMGALVILLALLPTAAAGRINESTKPWLPKVCSWCLALICYQPVAAMIYAIGFVLLGEGRDVGTILTGLAVMAMAVVAMPTMLKFFDWGGQKFSASGGGAGGGLMAAGAAASVMAGGGVGGFSQFMSRRGPASGDSGDASGAATVSSAHEGQGPGETATSGTGGRGQLGPGGAPQSSATGGKKSPAPHPTGGGAAAAAGSGAAKGAAPAGSGAAQSGGGAAAGVAGPAGAALQAAQVAKDKVGKTMTEGSDGGRGNG